MKSLDEIALQYECIKSSKVNNYTEKYQLHFESFRKKDIKVLEVGVAEGRSLSMWKDYFTKAKIYGLDIIDCSGLDDDRITTILGSQGDIPFLQNISSNQGPFDIIIDDGSHINEDIVTLFGTLFPLLNPGGIYVVESLLSCYWPWAQPNVNNNFNVVLQQLIHNVNACGKTSVTTPSKISEDPIYQSKTLGEMTWWDENVESLSVYRGIAFIKKY